MLVVGSSLAPVVPVAYSLAGRATPHHGARAVALVTTVGYSAFIVGPFIVGGLGGPTSLRTALLLLIGTTLDIALLGRRIAAPPPRSRCPDSPIRVTPCFVRNQPSGRFVRGTASLQ